MTAMLLQMGRNNGGPDNLFCDGLQFDHFVHHVLDVGGCDLEIRIVPETCVGAFEELEPRSFGGCCSDKDLVDSWQVETKERKAFIEIVTAIPETR